VTRWGIVSTIKAPLSVIGDFAAWHLELGAHRLYLYLDDDVPETLAVLKKHPKIKALHTDHTYWEKRNGRPVKHQVRQSKNARHANNRKQEVDWLAHIDVDEFLLPQGSVAKHLTALPDDCLCARLRPVEALAPDPAFPTDDTLFKAFHIPQQQRQQASQACFPTWGPHLSGGFLSHVAGKLFFRTGLKGLEIKIHNIIWNGTQNPGQIELPQIELGHFHAPDWAHFLRAYRFRLERGSYRSELKPQVRRDGAVNLHDLFQLIESEGGDAALADFFHEVCTASPDLCARLDQHGLLRRRKMACATLRKKHFPGVNGA
jgi:hypothetical protein